MLSYSTLKKKNNKKGIGKKNLEGLAALSSTAFARCMEAGKASCHFVS
jgi:hypothetical protein